VRLILVRSLIGSWPQLSENGWLGSQYLSPVKLLTLCPSQHGNKARLCVKKIELTWIVRVWQRWTNPAGIESDNRSAISKDQQVSDCHCKNRSVALWLSELQLHHQTMWKQVDQLNLLYQYRSQASVNNWTKSCITGSYNQQKCWKCNCTRGSLNCTSHRSVACAASLLIPTELWLHDLA